MFAFVPDFERAVAVFLFSGVIDDDDHDACERALQAFNGRLATTPLPVILLVDESRCEEPGLQFPHLYEVTPPMQTITLLAVVTPSGRGVLRAVVWAFATRYMVYAAQTLEDAMAWIERRREAELSSVFQRLLTEARSVTGPDTGR